MFYKLVSKVNSSLPPRIIRCYTTVCAAFFFWRSNRNQDWLFPRNEVLYVACLAANTKQWQKMRWEDADDKCNSTSWTWIRDVAIRGQPEGFKTRHLLTTSNISSISVLTFVCLFLRFHNLHNLFLTWGPHQLRSTGGKECLHCTDMQNHNAITGLYLKLIKYCSHTVVSWLSCGQ